jgi:hypothetical protein
MDDGNGSKKGAQVVVRRAASMWGGWRAWPCCLVVLMALSAAKAQQAALATTLPDSPGALLANDSGNAEAERAAGDGTTPQETPRSRSNQQKSALLPPCPKMSWRWHETPGEAAAEACAQDNPLQSIVSTGHVQPLTPSGKAVLAGRDIIDPFNLITVFGYSAIYVAAESHSPYGPGLKGFGRLSGYSLAEDTQGEFFGTFLIPTLAQEDPRYHRMPDQPLKRRILHALAHTVVSQHDDGTLMPNYAVLVTYPVSAALSDAYVPGIGTSASDTFKRIGLGYATNPVGDIVAEFLPDVAKRVHIRVVFVQQILNKVAAGSPNTQ